MATKIVRTKQYETNLRSAGGLHGHGLEGAAIGKGETIVIEVDTKRSPHDGWSLIVGPNPPINADGTYLNYGDQAWIEDAHVEDINMDITRFTIEVNWTTKTLRLV
jgi:hypothetical protein